MLATFWFSGSPSGAWGGSTAIRATASTAIMGALDRARATGSSSSRCATRRWPPSWPARHAKFTGEVGVCLATSGPGAIHLLNGLYDAKLDHQPVRRDRRPAGARGARRRLPAGGRPAHAVQGRRARVRAHGHRRRRRCATWSTARCASRSAERTVTCIIVPERRAGAGRGRAAAARARHGPLAASATSRPRVRAATTPTCARAAEVLNAGKRVAMLVGAGALQRDRRGDRGRRAARRGRRQGAARQGGACPTTCRSSPARSACSARKPSCELMSGCDTLLMVGSSFPYSEFLPEEGKARGVQIDIDGAHARASATRWRSNLVGDSARDAARAASACSSARPTAPGASEIEESVARLVAGAGGARDERGRPDQPAARLLGALAAAARRLHPQLPTRARRPTGTRATSSCGAG